MVAKGALENSRFSIPKDRGPGVVLVGSKGVLETSRFSIPKDRGPGVVQVWFWLVARGVFRKLQVFNTKG